MEKVCARGSGTRAVRGIAGLSEGRAGTNARPRARRKRKRPRIEAPPWNRGKIGNRLSRGRIVGTRAPAFKAEGSGGGGARGGVDGRLTRAPESGNVRAVHAAPSRLCLPGPTDSTIPGHAWIYSTSAGSSKSTG